MKGSNRPLLPSGAKCLLRKTPYFSHGFAAPHGEMVAVHGLDGKLSVDALPDKQAGMQKEGLGLSRFEAGTGPPKGWFIVAPRKRIDFVMAGRSIHLAAPHHLSGLGDVGIRVRACLPFAPLEPLQRKLQIQCRAAQSFCASVIPECNLWGKRDQKDKMIHLLTHRQQLLGHFKGNDAATRISGQTVRTMRLARPHRFNIAGSHSRNGGIHIRPAIRP